MSTIIREGGVPVEYGTPPPDDCGHIWTKQGIFWKLRDNLQYYYVINISIFLGVPISQYILYKQFHPNIELDTRFINIVQLPCVSSTLKFDNFISNIWKHGTVYNILQIKNNGVCIAICLVSGCTTPEHTFF